MYAVHCTVLNVHCTVQSVHWTEQSVHCTVQSVHWTEQSVHCLVCTCPDTAGRCWSTPTPWYWSKRSCEPNKTSVLHLTNKLHLYLQFSKQVIFPNDQCVLKNIKDNFYFDKVLLVPGESSVSPVSRRNISTRKYSSTVRFGIRFSRIMWEYREIRRLRCSFQVTQPGSGWTKGGAGLLLHQYLQSQVFKFSICSVLISEIK